jgi:hypothetical protein
MVVDPLTALKVCLGLATTCKDVYDAISNAAKKYKSYGERIVTFHDGLEGHAGRLETWKKNWEIGIGKPGEGRRYFGDEGWYRIQKTLRGIEEKSLQLVILLAPFKIPSDTLSQNPRPPQTHLRFLKGLSLQPRENNEGKKGKLRKRPPEGLLEGQKFIQGLGMLELQRLLDQNERVVEADRAGFMKKIKDVLSESGDKMESLIFNIKNELEVLHNDSDIECYVNHPKLSKDKSLDEKKRYVEKAWDIAYAKEFRRVALSLFALFPEEADSVSMNDVGFDLGGHRRASVSQRETFTFVVKEPLQRDSLEVLLRALGSKKPNNSTAVQLSNGFSEIYESPTTPTHISCTESDSSSASWFSIIPTKLDLEMVRYSNILLNPQSSLGILNGPVPIPNSDQSELHQLSESEKFELAFEILDAGILLLGMKSIPLINRYNLIIYRDKGIGKPVARCCYDFRSSSSLEDPLSEQIQQLKLRNPQIDPQAYIIGLLLLELVTELQVRDVRWSNDSILLTMSDGRAKDLEGWLSYASVELGTECGKAIRRCLELRQPEYIGREFRRDDQLREWLEKFYQSVLQP